MPPTLLDLKHINHALVSRKKKENRKKAAKRNTNQNHEATELEKKKESMYYISVVRGKPCCQWLQLCYPWYSTTISCWRRNSLKSCLRDLLACKSLHWESWGPRSQLLLLGLKLSYSLKMFVLLVCDICQTANKF